MQRQVWVVTVLLFCTVSSAYAQAGDNAIDRFFQSYVNDSRFSTVYISPRLFQMAGKVNLGSINLESDKEAKALQDVVKGMQGLRILSAKENGRQLFREAKSKISTKDYEPLMTVREGDGDIVEFWIREGANGKISELLLLSGGESNFTLLSFIGNLDMDKILKLAKEIDEE